jgi:hypothetical protein
MATITAADVRTLWQQWQALRPADPLSELALMVYQTTRAEYLAHQLALAEMALVGLIESLETGAARPELLAQAQAIRDHWPGSGSCLTDLGRATGKVGE